MRSKFQGTGVALATPMYEDGSIDYSSLEKLIEHTVTGGVNYLVVQGTTGESPTMSWKEKLGILSFVIEKTDKSVPVVFGLGGNSTQELLDKAKELRKFDIAAFLSVSPYYSRPSQEGIIQHFRALADSFHRPIILYNVPARTASNVTADTTLALANHPNIVGMKEASGDFAQCKKIIKNKPSDFLLLSGDDQMTYKLIGEGAEGVISVIANLIPEGFTKMVNKALADDSEGASKYEIELSKAYELLSQEGNPTSLKTGLAVQNICNTTVRLPLISGSNMLKKAWEEFFRHYKA